MTAKRKLRHFRQNRCMFLSGSVCRYSAQPLKRGMPIIFIGTSFPLKAIFN
ncbi:Hypothetical protein ABZS17G119_03623 [Kosakonia cowanii]